MTFRQLKNFFNLNETKVDESKDTIGLSTVENHMPQKPEPTKLSEVFALPKPPLNYDSRNYTPATFLSSWPSEDSNAKSTISSEKTSFIKK